jgi:dCTP deaminase
MLSDTDIRIELERNKRIIIDPFDEDSLTPVGYDLRVGEKGFSWKKQSKVEINEQKPLTIEPNDTVVIETYESVQLSKQFAGIIHAMATQVIRRELSHISTTVDPGWKGRMLISIHNYRTSAVELEFKEKFCTICFYKVQSEAKKDVGKPSGRSDIWSELLDKASQEKKRIETERRREEERRKQEERLRKTFLTFIVIAITAVGIGGYFVLGPALDAVLISSITAASVLLPDIFKSREV